jgi:PAS domain S-box-containing protein
LKNQEKIKTAVHGSAKASKKNSSRSTVKRQDIQRSERRFQSLSENVPGAVYEYYFKKDGTFGFRYLSPVVYRMFGIPPAAMMNSFDHIHPDDRPALLTAIQHTADTSEPFYFEGRLITPGGQVKWHAASSSLSYKTRSGTRIFTGIILDITSRKEAEEQLLKNESRFRLVLEKVGDNVWEHDFLKNETSFSGNIADLLGYPANNNADNVELWWSHVYPFDKHLLEETDRKYRNGEINHHSMEYRMYHATGKIKWILDRGVVTEKTEEGKPARIIGTHTDITVQKELQEFRDQVQHQKKKEIIKAVIAAHERERQEISNELHENIMQMLTSCKFLLYSAKNEIKDQAVLPKIEATIVTIIAEIRNIDYNLSSSALQLIGLSQALEDLLERVGKKEKWKISFDAAGYKSRLKTDPVILLAIYRMAQEQLMNIVKHAGASSVSMRLRTVQQRICLDINDDGRGFEPKQLKKGLGFTNILARAEDHNGKVTIKTSPGKGCQVSITMPADPSVSRN